MWMWMHIPALRDAAAEVSAVLALHSNVLCAFDLGVERCSVARLAVWFPCINHSVHDGVAWLDMAAGKRAGGQSATYCVSRR